MTEIIRIALFDDHPLMRDGIASTLNCENDMEVVADGASKDEAVELTQRELPDIVMLDVSMPGGGISAAQEISTSCPVVRIVMLTVSEDEEDVSAALRAGAHGYILKGVRGSELIRNLRAVYNGENYVSPSLAARLLADHKDNKNKKRSKTDLLSDLTAREEQVLKYVAKGLSNKEVGLELDLREKTVKHYMTNILQKLQVRNRVEAALVAQSQSGMANS